MALGLIPIRWYSSDKSVHVPLLIPDNHVQKTTVYEVLLFWRNLAHIYPDTDDFTGLHPHWAGDIITACSAHRCVAGRDGWVLHALPPRASLPVVHSAGMVIAVPHLLQGTDVGTLDSTWEMIQHKLVSIFLLYGRQKGITSSNTLRQKTYWKLLGINVEYSII